MERTFAMLKPDAVHRGLVGEIIARIERTGLRLWAMHMLQPAPEQAAEQYGQEIADKYGEQVRAWLIEYVCGGQAVVMVWEGPNAVQTVRALAGDKPAPADCLPGSIRRDLSLDSADLATREGRAIHNLIHTSDSPEAAQREIALWFGDDGA